MKIVSPLEKAMGISIFDVLDFYNIPVVNNKICCLWHEDTHPSAHIYDDSNKGYCFACSKGPFNSLDIVMEKENLDAKGAMNFLIQNFTVNRTYIAKEKKNLELYFKLNDELRNMIKQGIDINLINRFGSIMDNFSDNQKILLRTYNALIKRVNNAGKGNDISKKI